MSIQIAGVAITLRQPGLEDGAAIWELVRGTKPLDRNSCYAYLLLCTHFADTCLVAEDCGELVGFVSAYRPPAARDVLFVWQVAVQSKARGKGLGKAMICTLLKRQDVTFLEATVTGSNVASQALFRSLANEENAPCKETCWFPPEAFGSNQHEAEILFTIGPLQVR